MTGPMFKGVVCALVTPFSNGVLDEDALLGLAERQVIHGAAGLVIGSVVGEGWALSDRERARAVELAVQGVAHKVPVLAAVDADTPAVALDQAAAAKAAGAAGLLVSSPGRFKPDQAALHAHFAAVAEGAGLPVMLRATRLSVGALACLAKVKGVVGAVDGTADLGRASAMRRACPDGFCLFTSDDASALAFMAHGGHGLLSRTANVAPKSVTGPITWWSEDDAARALASQARMIALHQAVAEAGAAGIKFALSRMGGLCAPDVRAPLRPLTDDQQQHLMLAMDGAAEPMHPY